MTGLRTICSPPSAERTKSPEVWYDFSVNLFSGTWLAAVSSGPDSMALLHWCMEQGISVAAAHVNYHHRPEAEEEEMYVRSFCREHGIVLHVKNDPFEYTGNFEAKAREYRYSFFADIVKAYGYRGVLTGHQMDDLIETYFMQKEKNIIPEYYGLKEERFIHGVLVVRPMLGHTAEELRQYCREHHVRYYIDSSNADLSLSRNRIRDSLVKGMSDFERRMVLEEIAKENAVLQERRCRVSASVREESFLLLDYRAMEEEDRLTLLRTFFDTGTRHAARAHLKEADAILTSGRDFLIPCGEKRLADNRGTVFLQEIPEPYSFRVNSVGELKGLRCPYFEIAEGVPGVNAVTVREADFPMVIRNAREKDRISMRFGTKKVHRFFIDRHIPRCFRDSWPVVENAEGKIILVPGLGCDIDHYSIWPDFSVIQYSH